MGLIHAAGWNENRKLQGKYLFFIRSKDFITTESARNIIQISRESKAKKISIKPFGKRTWKVLPKETQFASGSRLDEVAKKGATKANVAKIEVELRQPCRKEAHDGCLRKLRKQNAFARPPTFVGKPFLLPRWSQKRRGNSRKSRPWSEKFLECSHTLSSLSFLLMFRDAYILRLSLTVRERELHGYIASRSVTKNNFPWRERIHWLNTGHMASLLIAIV